MKKYECTVCGYIYDPEEGDSDGGITAGTAFEKLARRLGLPDMRGGEERVHTGRLTGG